MKIYILASMMYFYPSFDQTKHIQIRFSGNKWIEILLASFDMDRKLRTEIVKRIHNTDSKEVAVKSLYEENPYPRWFYFDFLEFNSSIDIVIRKYCRKSIHWADKASNPRVLIAGCGTGKQVVGFAKNMKYSELIAIDISYASLQYAQYIAREAHIDKVYFYQVDILEINEHDIGTFDYIECVGVLHHLKNPLIGFNKLKSILNKNGIIKIGIYSAKARRKINDFRCKYKLETDNYNIKELYAIRNDIVTGEDKSFCDLLKWPDFYSASSFRDMVSYVQEHQYTIPQIQDFLDKSGFGFLGFHVSYELIKIFSEMYEDKKFLSDLNCWHQFENKYPDSFAGMYQFWCQKID